MAPLQLENNQKKLKRLIEKKKLLLLENIVKRYKSVKKVKIDGQNPRLLLLAPNYYKGEILYPLQIQG
jgi:hypothetical protein